MEARLQHHDSRTASEHLVPEPGPTPVVPPSYSNEDVQIEFSPPVHYEEHRREEPQLLPPPYLPTPPSTDPGQSNADKDEEMLPEIEFSTQWNNRKEAVWDIVAPKRKTQPLPSDPPIKARARPIMWAENIYDAQDVLPYFTVGQTILASKIPREVSRSVLLTKNLHEISTDWKAGTIRFAVQVRYKLQLSRPKKWKAPDSPSKLVNSNCKPMDPIQFRKLRACCEAGIPVRVLARGDFPTLPIFHERSYAKENSAYSISSSNWQNGVVMLGFFWVKKVMEQQSVSEKEDLETGKCSGWSNWTFEFLSCDINEHPLPWWCPDDSEGHITQQGSSVEDDEPELGNASKRRRLDSDTKPEFCGDVSMSEVVKQDEAIDEPKVEMAPSHPTIDPSCIDPILFDPASLNPTSLNPTSLDPALPGPALLDMDSAHAQIHPNDLGLSLKPQTGTNECLSRAPKLRASLLLGWLCSTCGRLNPRKKWSKQLCPLCETTPTPLLLPEWNRRAHTEAAGPIGTHFRLDDGGHQPKTGLHQMTARNEETGLTFVEYWLAEAPMPIIAEINRDTSANRRKTRKKAALPQMLQSLDISNADSQAVTPSTSTPDSSNITQTLPSSSSQSTLTAPTVKGGTHPDGGQLIRQRDPGGSRAVFSDNTRMLFMHITCPQHSGGLELLDRIFSAFATDVEMERQENSSSYKTGASALSCHYTYLAGCGTHIMHTSSPAVDWKDVPDCVYDAHTLLVDYQAHTVFDDNKTIREFNQSIYIMGNGATGTSTFRFIHRAEDGPVGYMVLGASCSIEILVGSGEKAKRTTKGEAARRAEMLLAHGDALLTMPMEGDAPLEVRVKRTGLAVVSMARYVPPEPIQIKKARAVPQKKRIPNSIQENTPTQRSTSSAKRKARASEC